MGVYEMATPTGNEAAVFRGCVVSTAGKGSGSILSTVFTQAWKARVIVIRKQMWIFPVIRLVGLLLQINVVVQRVFHGRWVAIQYVAGYIIIMLPDESNRKYAHSLRGSGCFQEPI